MYRRPPKTPTPQQAPQWAELATKFQIVQWGPKGLRVSYTGVCGVLKTSSQEQAEAGPSQERGVVEQ